MCHCRIGSKQEVEHIILKSWRWVRGNRHIELCQISTMERANICLSSRCCSDAVQKFHKYPHTTENTADPAHSAPTRNCYAGFSFKAALVCGRASESVHYSTKVLFKMFTPLL